MVRQYICVRLSPDVYSSQGSVAMRLRCGEIFTKISSKVKEV